jgi:hypothetical protein
MKFKMQNLRVCPAKSVPSLAEQAWSHEDPTISASISASLSTRSLISALATRRIAGQC